MIERKYLAEGHAALKAAVDPVPVTEDGRFYGYGAVFGNRDLVGDIIESNAFRDLDPEAEYSLLDHHSQNSPLGVFRVSTDSKGLRVKGYLNVQVQRAREVRALMQQGALTGLSIGYSIPNGGSHRKDGTRYLQKIDLLEVSVVTFPANPLARIIGVKAQRAEQERRKTVKALKLLIEDIKDYTKRMKAA
jgi:HK97 family phage prohead protease